MHKIIGLLVVLVVLGYWYSLPLPARATVGDVTIDQSAGGSSTLGIVTAQKLVDTASSAYFLDPAATSNSLVTAGDATVSGNIALGNAKTIRSAFGPLQLQYKSGMDAWTTGLTLQDTTGNVGIGTTSPATKFQVSGSLPMIRLTDTTTPVSMDMEVNTTTGYIGTITSHPLGFLTGNSTKMVLDTSGRLAINSASTGLSNLGVVGNAAVGATYGLLAAPTSGMIIEGNVGIGTTSPGSHLDIRSSGTDRQILAENTGSGNLEVLRIHQLLPNTTWADMGPYITLGAQTSSGTGEHARIRSGWSTNADSSNAYLAFHTLLNNTMAERVRISNNGNVGIGTTVPGGKLDIESTDNPGTSLLRLGDLGCSTCNFDFSRDPVNGVLKIQGNQVSYSNIVLAPTSGNVGIGTTSPSTALQVVGTITGTTKNFEIDHPTKPGMKLIHSTVEGPEVAVFYRGESTLVNGKMVVALPDYFEALTRKEGRTVQLTAKNSWSPLYVDGEVVNGRFTVKADSGNSNQQFYWEVKAVRADVEPLVVEKSVN